MLPEVAEINDIYANFSDPSDEDSTLTKRRSFADQYLLFCRQNLREHSENNFTSGHETLRDVILIQDECVTPLRDVIARVDYAQLTSLYIIDSKLHATDFEAFEKLSLHVLVLTHTHLRSVPQQVLDMADLQVLKLDRNRLEELPADIARLRSLRTLCCDSQRPRLRSLPGQALRQLTCLQVLTFSNNRIDDISWCDTMTSLRTLKCDRNRLTRLPYQLANLPHLQVLNVSHNRLEAIPNSFTHLLRRLHRFDFYNVTLRPKHLRHDVTHLLTSLELDNFLLQHDSEPRATRDVTIGVVGESHSGKASLVDALAATMTARTGSRSDSRDATTSSSSASGTSSSYNIQQFEMTQGDVSAYVSCVVMGGDFLDN